MGARQEEEYELCVKRCMEEGRSPTLSVQNNRPKPGCKTRRNFSSHVEELAEGPIRIEISHEIQLFRLHRCCVVVVAGVLDLLVNRLIDQGDHFFAFCVGHRGTSVPES